MSDAKTVLVVDDASLVRLYYRTTLEAAGYRVEEALNGLEAFEKLLALRVDLLIVDINMPKMDGITFLAALRQKPGALGSIPALVMSTESGEVDFQAARSAGANYYLTKPAAAQTLLELTAMLCGCVHE